MKKWMLAGLVLTALMNAAQAAPSTTGSTGLIDTPTADTLRAGQISLGYFDLEESRNMSFGMNLAKNLELSAGSAAFEDSVRKTYVNVKYAIKQESVLLPGVAIGMEDIGGAVDRTAYAVVSKSLPLGFRVHAGLGGGRYDGAFYGLEKTLVPMAVGGVFPDTSLLVEYDGHEMNYGLRMSLVTGLKINAGLRGDDPYIGVTYNWY